MSRSFHLIIRQPSNSNINKQILKGFLITNQRIQSRLFSLSSTKMSESEEDNVPDGATAQKLVKEFESITNTDEIMGQMYLQVKSIFKNLFYINLLI